MESSTELTAGDTSASSSSDTAADTPASRSRDPYWEEVGGCGRKGRDDCLARNPSRAHASSLYPKSHRPHIDIEMLLSKFTSLSPSSQPRSPNSRREARDGQPANLCQSPSPALHAEACGDRQGERPSSSDAGSSTSFPSTTRCVVLSFSLSLFLSFSLSFFLSVSYRWRGDRRVTSC